MRKVTIETFQSTMNNCFNTVVENILGRTVREQILNLLERNGILRSDISSRFDDVIQILTKTFGDAVRVLLFKTVTELYKTYSIRANFTVGESLNDQVELLRASVVSGLDARRSQHIDDPVYGTTQQRKIK